MKRIRKLFQGHGCRLAVLFIVLSTLLVYVNSLSSAFVWDDVSVIVENNFIKSWKNLPLLFSRAYLTPYTEMGNFYVGDFTRGSGEMSYRPAVTLSYFIDYAIWKLCPFGYHLTNLLLHICNAILFFTFVNLLLKDNKTALLAALIFALHPVNAEAVNVTAFREDLLAFLFFFSCLILYIKSEGDGARKTRYFYPLSLFFFFFAVLSKEMAITLPLVLVLYDHYFRPDRGWKDFFYRARSRYPAFFALLLSYLAVRFFVMANPTVPKINYPGGNFFTNIITMTQVIFIYLQWLIIPVNIHVVLREYHQLLAHSIFNLKSLCAILIMACCCRAIILKKISKPAAFAILFFFLTLLPVLNIWPLVNFIAGRYLYIPMAGFCLWIAVLSAKWARRHKAMNLAIAVWLVLLAMITSARNNAWKDDSALLRELYAYNPASPAAHCQMAGQLLQKNLFDGAIEEYRAAIKLNPGAALLYKELSRAYYLKKDPRLALKELDTAAELSPKLPGLSRAYYDIAGSYYDLKEYPQAIAAYRKAIGKDPGYIEAYNNLASVLADSGNAGQAIELWNKAVSLKPDFAVAHFNLAVFYFQEQKYDLAIEHCDKVIALGNSVDRKFLERLKPYRKDKQR